MKRRARFVKVSLLACGCIAYIGSYFIKDGQTVLMYGWSRVVAGILLKASRIKHFSIVVLKGWSDALGIEAVSFYSHYIPTLTVLDSVIGYIMKNVHIVLVGAEGAAMEQPR